MELPSIPALTERPSHVPAELVRDVDIFNLDGHHDDVHLAWKKVQDTHPDIFWTPRNGGYWMVTRADLIEEIQNDYEHFSMRRMLIPNVPRPFPAPPIDLEPPEHGPYRMLISPAFSPKVVNEVSEAVKQTTIEIIEGLRPKGECEFVTEFSKVLPIVVFLRMMNLPLEDREELLPHADAIVRSPDPMNIVSARLALKAYIQKAVDYRKEHPQEDLITKIMHAKINGEPIPEERVVGMCTLLLSGGLDTVKNLLGFCARFLAMHPEHVKQLREDPAIIPNAVEELIRRHGVSNTAREIVMDYEFHGLQLKKGEQIQGVTALFGLDERRIEDPLRVDFYRPAPVPHAAFGNGPHKCPGSILAKRELRVFLEEWIPRIPEFRIKPGTTPQICSGMVNQVSELWLSWDVPA
jgi:cytochrome P450